MIFKQSWRFRKWRREIVSLAVMAAVLLLGVPTAGAHRDDYIDETLVFLTLGRHETEIEYWFDYGSNSPHADDFLRHNFALEYGITDHWMVDGRATVETPTSEKSTQFESGRVESRYRFMDEGSLPVDMAVSGEVNWNREEDGSAVVRFEPRLILSRDFGERLNLTLNLSEEIPFRAASPAFLLASGIRFRWSELIRLGSEFQYNFDEHAGSVIPQVWLAFPQDLTLKIGYSKSLNQNDEDFVRVALELEV